MRQTDRMLRHLLAITLLVLAVAACAEKPPRVEPGPAHADALPHGAGHPLRERAAAQGESTRIYH